MKHKLSFLTKLGIVLVLGIVLAGCPQEAELSSTATVGSVTVAGKNAILGTPSMDWMEAKEPENSGTVFLTSAQMNNAEVVITKGQDGQKIYLATAKPSVMPDFVENITSFHFDPLDYLWVEVFSENHDDYKVYAIQIMTSTPTILDVTLGGRSAVGGVYPNGERFQQYGKGMGIHNIDLAQTQEGEIWFGNNENGTQLNVIATPEDIDSTVLIATGTANDSAATLFPPNYTSPASITVNNGNYLYIKSISADAENGETIFYKLKLVAKSTNLDISDITIQANGGNPVSFVAGAPGTNGFGGGENHRDGAQLDPGNGAKNILQIDPGTPIEVTVLIGTPPAGSKVRYGCTDFFNAQEDVFSSGHKMLVYQENNVLSNVTSLDYIAVEVENELGDKGWYAFRVAIGPSSDVTTMEINGTTVNLDEARNPNLSGINRYQYRPAISPVDSDGDGLWDNITFRLAGFDHSVSSVRITTANTINEVVADEDWIPISTDDFSTSFNNVIGTSNFVFVHLKNPDDLEYYYKVQAAYGNDEYTMTALTIDGSPATVGIPSGLDYIRNRRGPMWDGERSVFTLTGSAPVSLALAATGSPGATFRYGWLIPGRDYSVVLPTNTGTNIWKTTESLTSAGIVSETLLRQGYDIVIEVSSEDKTNITYYVVLFTLR